MFLKDNLPLFCQTTYLYAYNITVIKKRKKQDD